MLTILYGLDYVRKVCICPVVLRVTYFGMFSIERLFRAI